MLPFCLTMFNFKKLTAAYLVDSSNNQHTLQMYPDFTMSQTFSERDIKKKTLHQQNNLHQGAKISRANPANFNFTFPILDDSNTPPLILLATEYANGTISYGDLYIVADNITYLINKAVIETITFNFTANEVITASINGSAKSIEPFVGSIPGTPVTISNLVYNSVRTTDIEIDSVSLGSVVSLNLEIANSVQWLENQTLHDTINSSIVYPENYVVTERRVSGSLTEFLTSDNSSDLSSYAEGVDIDITIGSTTAAALLRFHLPSSTYTRRETPGDVYTRTYDFRLDSNNNTVKPIYKGV